MSNLSSGLTGVAETRSQLDALAKAGPSIGAASVRSGVNTMASAAKAAVPGGIKREIGGYVRIQGNQVIGRVGLMQYPNPGDTDPMPHGVFLESGTRYIAARHMIANAMQTARPQAEAAMKRTAARKINYLKKGKS